MLCCTFTQLLQTLLMRKALSNEARGDDGSLSQQRDTKTLASHESPTFGFLSLDLQLVLRSWLSSSISTTSFSSFNPYLLSTTPPVLLFNLRYSFNDNKSNVSHPLHHCDSPFQGTILVPSRLQAMERLCQVFDLSILNHQPSRR